MNFTAKFIKFPNLLFKKSLYISFIKVLDKLDINFFKVLNE